MGKMSVILDTSFLIALNDSGDINHKNAQSLKIKIANYEIGKSYTSDYIFDELVTFMRAKSVNLEKIKSIGDALLSDPSIELLNIDIDRFQKSWELFKKFNKLSFTDCTTLALTQEFRIKNIASFDSGFDGIKNLKRLP